MGEEISEKEYLRGLYKTAIAQKATADEQAKILERLEQALADALERHDQQIRLLAQCASSLRNLVFWYILLPVGFLITIVLLVGYWLAGGRLS